jgi:translation initiation factor 1A
MVNNIKVRLPRNNEQYGIVIRLLGASRFEVKCEDNNTRVARIPGKLKKIKIREGDIVLIEPWIVQSNEKCDIVFRYTKTHILNLKSINKYPTNL